jgi:hypothetical protein
MKRAHKWLVGLGIVLLLAGAAWVAALRFLPSDEELARRASAELETALGVKVRVGALHWRLFPSPAVVMEDAATDQPQPIVIKKLTLYPDLFALWQRRIKIDRADLEGASVPQPSLRGLGKQREKEEPTGEELPLARFVFRDLTWISRRGIPVVYDGEVDFDPGWRPRKAELRRPGAKDAAHLTLTRQGQDDRWAARIQVGGGTAAWRCPARHPRGRAPAPARQAAAQGHRGRKHDGHLQPPLGHRGPGLGRHHAHGQRRHGG